MNIEPYLIMLILGGTLIACEILILQASLGWLLLLGFASLITSLMLWFMPSLSMVEGIGILIINSILALLILYKPMRRWQNQPSRMGGNDAYGQKAKVIESIGVDAPGKVEWSGATWEAHLDDSSDQQQKEVGAMVEIVNASGIMFTVK